jgi:catechol 2,3-dioxygenase-like lactoylglutathione lyase family enzyme
VICIGREQVEEAAVQPICHLVEAGIYVDDLDRAEALYRDMLSLTLIGREKGRHVFFKAGEAVLLVFNANETLKGTTLPAHGCKGPGHVALGIPKEAIDEWRSRLAEHGVAIEKEVAWPRGGHSLYFRDPAGNSVELVTPGCWGLPSGW